MQQNPQVIHCTGTDRTGKDTLRRHIVKNSKGNSLVIVRSFIDQVTYARIYNRPIHEDWFIHQALECQKLGHIFIYLEADHQLIAQRIVDTYEKDITADDIDYHKQIFNEVIVDFEKAGLIVNRINTTDQDLNRMYKEVQIAIIQTSIQMCKNCTLCGLDKNKKDISLGYGKLIADIKTINPKYLIVGINPSSVRYKDTQYPFEISGERNLRFRGILDDLGILQQSVITNLIKCTTSEGYGLNYAFEHCNSFIENEIKLYNPEYIIALGKDVKKKIVENKLFNIDKIIEIYHPSYCYSRNSITHNQYKQHIISRLNEDTLNR